MLKLWFKGKVCTAWKVPKCGGKDSAKVTVWNCFAGYAKQKVVA